MTVDATTDRTRPLARVVAASRTIEGGGFEVYRPFPTPALDWLAATSRE